MHIRQKFISPSTELGKLDRNSFLPRGEALRVFTEQKRNVESLFVLANPTKIDRDLGNLFYKAVVASDVKVEETREDRALCNILALLIHLGTQAKSEEWQGFEALVRSIIESQPSGCSDSVETMPSTLAVCDGNLPMELEDIENHFGTARAYSMHPAQFQFCPVILRKNRLLTLEDWHILPFLEPEIKIGEGSHGSVYKVLVAQRHFRDKRGNANGRPTYFARKDFKKLAEDNTGYEAEWAIIQRFVRNLTKSETVMMTCASFQRGTTFSVFFDLALSDLSEYMKQDLNRIDDWRWKRHILRQAFHLAQGLNYLHNQLIDDSTSDRISCFHTDLKPSNILVVEAPQSPNGPLYDRSFKITDFSVSRISYRDHKDVEGTDVGRPFHRKDTSARNLSVTNWVGAANQCLAPEALPINARVKASADIWAFGCVLSIVVAWVYGGKEAVEDFRMQRSQETKSTFTMSADWFFTPLGRKSATSKEHDLVATIHEITGPRERILSINPAVQPWFKRIVTESQGMEQVMYRKIWDLLGSSVLVAKPTERYPIESVWETLEGILRATTDIRRTQPLSPPSGTHPISNTRSSFTAESTSTSTAHSPGPARLSRKPELLALRSHQGSTAEHESRVVKVELQNKNGASRCLASPDGTHIVFFEIHDISWVSLNDVLLARSSKSHTEIAESLHSPDQQSWATVGLSDNYLCAASNSSSQTTFVLCNLTAKHDEQVGLLNKASCDHGNCTAVAVCRERHTSAVIIVYAAETRDEGSKDRAVFWFEQTTAPREGVSRPTPTRLKLHHKLSGEIKDLRVSADGRYVSIVEQTTSGSVQVKITIRVHTWDLWRNKERYILETSPDRTGSARSVFTSIVHLSDQPGFILIMQESEVKIFNFRTAEITRLLTTTDKDTSSYLQCIPEKGGRSLLVGFPIGTKVVGVHKYISTGEASVSGFPVMVAQKTPVFRPSDCAAIRYTSNHKQGILILAHCDSKGGKIEIMRCPMKPIVGGT